MPCSFVVCMLKKGKKINVILCYNIRVLGEGVNGHPNKVEELHLGGVKGKDLEKDLNYVCMQILGTHVAKRNIHRPHI